MNCPPQDFIHECFLANSIIADSSSTEALLLPSCVEGNELKSP
jgi:hypothetical protein